MPARQTISRLIKLIKFIMKSREQQPDGLYYPDGSFKDQNQIKRDQALRGELPEMSIDSSIKLPLDVYTYLDASRERGMQIRELSPRSDSQVDVRLPRTSIINVLGDIHFGHPETDTERLKQELELIRNTPDSFIIFNGDLVDGIFWGGASGGEQSANLDEQRFFLASLFNALKGRVIVGTSGEHDRKWATKSGADPYFDFSERTGAPYVRGTAELRLKVGFIEYKIAVGHRKRGHSMYNKNHPTYRESRFELQDADIYISSHTHRKQISQEAIRKFRRADMITHISTGTYKGGDVYGDQQGYIPQLDKEKYGVSFRVHENRKLVEVDYSIVEAHRKWS